MSSYTHVTHNSLGGNIVNSIKSFLVGVILFIVSFPLLWWNEGRLDVSTIAKKAVVVAADGAGGKGEGDLIAVTAGLTNDDAVGDPDFVKPGAHVSVVRKAEMYAWVEKKETEERKNVGGSSDTITTYTYETKWTDDPQRSDSFEHPDDHENPDMPLDSAAFFATSAHVGSFVVTPKDIELPPSKPLTLSDDMMITYSPQPSAAQVDAPPTKGAPSAKPHGSAAPTASASAKPHTSASASAKPKSSASPHASVKAAGSSSATAASGNDADVAHTHVPIATLHPHREGQFVYMGDGSESHPKVGDVRVSFEVVDPTPGPVTLYGIRKGNGVTPWIEPGDKLMPAKLYRIVPGTHEQAIALMHGEYETLTWILRGVGFFLMWIGLALTVSPINTVLDIVPFVGQAGRLVTSLVMFPIALVLTSLTIVLSILAHHPLMLLIPLAALIGVFVLVKVFRKTPPQQQPPMGPPGGGYYPPPQYPQGGYGGGYPQGPYGQG